MTPLRQVGIVGTPRVQVLHITEGALRREPLHSTKVSVKPCVSDAGGLVNFAPQAGLRCVGSFVTEHGAQSGQVASQEKTNSPSRRSNKHTLAYEPVEIGQVPLQHREKVLVLVLLSGTKSHKDCVSRVVGVSLVENPLHNLHRAGGPPLVEPQ